ncbi:MAG TPA: hydantoinase/oxoprolinase family protein [Candidatus Dormibacteraeota bacterium]|nr:hydantoinase/oxoprolinase family protein [Candidatus Dormibacteraeota bacterium]
MSNDNLRFRLGTDVGGTFTDVWARASDGRVRTVKVPTTPDVIGGLIAAVEQAAEAFGLEVGDFCRRVDRFGHGTTVGLNALLTGHAARTAVLTTAGFADTMEIGRMRRQVLGLSEREVSDYHLRGRWPAIVPRSRVREVRERVDSTGRVLVPLDEAQAREAVREVIAAGVDAVAICTLWSTREPAHERRLRELVRAVAADVFVSVSHEVSPAVGEYARMTTTAANAALGPVMGRYLEALGGELRCRSLPVEILVMTSAGGVAPAPALVESPVIALLSGPAGAVMGCLAIGRATGREHLLTMDVGGTSFDVGVVIGGRPLMRSELVLGGVELRLPSVDVSSIGAGGGSIASVQDGVLRVGPESAGSTPGPACYARGGTRPTATDADLLLGLVGADTFLGGRMRLDRRAAEAAVRDHVARPLGIGLHQAAWGIREVLDSRMADLLRRVTIERGHDPADFLLVACGGSGPSHAWSLCRELGIASFVVPPTASAQSAFGTGTSDYRRTVEVPAYLRIPPGVQPTRDQVATLAAALETVTRAVRERLRRDVPDLPATVELSCAVRYRGQAHHLDVDVPGSAFGPTAFDRLLEDFERRYEMLFGRGSAFREAGFEVLSVRGVGVGRSEPVGAWAGGDRFLRLGTRDVYFDTPERPYRAIVYGVENPAPGQRLEGPCLVEFPGHTVAVPPWGWARTDEHGNLHVEVGT